MSRKNVINTSAVFMFCLAFTTMNAQIGIVSSDAPVSNSFEITGKLDKGIEGKVKMIYRNINRTVVKHAEVKNGEFTLSGVVKRPTKAFLILNPSDIDSKEFPSASSNEDVKEFTLQPTIYKMNSPKGLKEAVIKGGGIELKEMSKDGIEKLR